MTAADRMAAHLAQQARQRVEFDALARAADQGDSSLPTSPARRRVLADAAHELARRGLARLPGGPGGWDYSAHPPLPRWIQRMPRPRSPRPRPGPRAWVPQLSFATTLQLSAADHALLGPVNAHLRDHPDAEIIPLAERSYELYGDEKRLSRIEHHHLVTAGLLNITNHLRARGTPAPLAMLELGPAPWLLVVENSATFASLRQIFAAWPDHAQVGWLGYGSGDQLVASLPTAADSFRERDHPVTDLLLYGDLDLDGLQCAQQANARARAAGLPPLTAAAGLYQALLGRRPRRLSPAAPGDVRAAVSWLPAHLAEPVQQMLTAGIVLRQEALALPGLRAHLDPGAPLLPQLHGDPRPVPDAERTLSSCPSSPVPIAP
ncbi:hypothetical protein ABZW18_00670 [Streptomyces sp. NPDC004647]|uniref:hypothetical protein n=1 Tax=Streptomyces sp. NPDC004647 TaxID=3154671 RepID=UPI0033A876FC